MGGEAEGKMHCESIELCSSDIVNPNIKLRDLEAQTKPHKIQVQSTWVL